MNRTFLRLIISLICLALVIPAHATNTASASSTPPATATPITDPALVEQHYRQVLQRPEFQTSDETDMATIIKDSLLQWYSHLQARLGESQNTRVIQNLSLLFLAILLLLTIAGLIYIVLLFSRRRNFREEILSETIPGQKLFRPPEFYDEEIRRAIGAGDWHAAWLVAWRQFLSRLENRRLVEADRTRTNREYLAQLRRQTLPSPAITLLAQMVDAYDLFIYGRKPIGETDWNHFHQQVGEATLLLHLNEKASRLGGKQGSA